MTPGARQVIAAIGGWLAGAGRRPPERPLVVALDGPGASGKTTIAAEVAGELGALTIHTDDFLRPVPGGREAGCGPAEAGEPMARYYEWRALRARALEPALASEGRLVLLEGVSSSCRALSDLVGRAVLVLTPEAIRLERLHARVSDEEWDEEWLAAERLYFATRPPQSFDLVVSGHHGEPLGPTITAR